MKTPYHPNNPGLRYGPRPADQGSYARYPSSYEDFVPYFSKAWRTRFVRAFGLLAIIAIIAALAATSS